MISKSASNNVENLNQKSRSLLEEAYITTRRNGNKTPSRASSFISPRAHKAPTTKPRSKSYVFKNVDFDPKVPIEPKTHLFAKVNVISEDRGWKVSLTHSDVFDSYENEDIAGDRKQGKESFLPPSTKKYVENSCSREPLIRRVQTDKKNRQPYKHTQKDFLPDHLKSLVTAFSKLDVSRFDNI